MPMDSRGKARCRPVKGAHRRIAAPPVRSRTSRRPDARTRKAGRAADLRWLETSQDNNAPAPAKPTRYGMAARTACRGRIGLRSSYPIRNKTRWPANSGVRLRRLGNSALLLIASAASATLKGGGGLANRPIRRMRRGGVADCGSLVFIEVQRSVLRGVYAETDPLDPDGPHTGHRLGLQSHLPAGPGCCQPLIRSRTQQTR